VEHVLEKNTIRFYICATKNIPEGKEITMPFSYDYRKWYVPEMHYLTFGVSSSLQYFSSMRPL